MKLRSLKARSVRGIPRDWPDVSIGDRGLVIFGPNGVGKSSIVDAIEYAVSGKSSLYPVRRQNVNWDTGAPHIRGGRPDLCVEVTGHGSTFLLHPELEIDAFPEADRTWIAVGRNATFVLRRHMLLRFILEEPSGRYTLLEPFMNLGTFQAVEDALKDRKDRLETSLAVATSELDERAGRLRAVFGIRPLDAISEAALVAKINAVLQELGIGGITQASDLEARQARIASELGGTQRNARLGALAALKTQAQRLGTPAHLTELLASFASALDSLTREITTRTEAVLTDLLLLGKEAIETAGLQICPLCEQEIDREAVLARLQERIEADERITAARVLVSQRRSELLRHVRALSDPIKVFIHDWSGHLQTSLPSMYERTAVLLAELEAVVETETPNLTQLREFTARLSGAIANHIEVIATLDRLIVEEGGGARRLDLISAASMIEAMLTDWGHYSLSARNAAGIERDKAAIARLHGHAVEARKDTVRTILDEVATTANRFYEAIHPAEGLGTSNLQVRDVGQGSVILATDFHGTRENPLLHYSESHLDTLGLCYFLAFRKHEAQKVPGFKVLVLDDVMHSVDSEHRGRIAALIKREFGDHQLIVTTHDIHFYDALYRELGGGGYEYGRINNWDLERGPVFGDPLTDFGRITITEERDRLSEESLSAAGGRFFEWLLREATEALQVAIPARFSRGYEIGQLWPALAARLNRQRGYKSAHRGMIDALESNGWVRNACGAHYNPSPAPATPREVREFAAMLAALHESLRCNECRGFIQKQADRSWRCRCGHLAYSE